MSETPSTITAALRQAADLLDQHPDLPQPYIVSSYAGTAALNWYVDIDHPGDLSKQKATAAQIVKALGGHWDKQDRGDDFDFSQQRGLLKLLVKVNRPAVCERVVVGTETVTIPGKPAEPERTVEREVVEWRCQPLLADAESAVA